MGIMDALLRKKSTEEDGDDSKPALARVLTVVDLTALGVGSTLGAGVYVLSGEVGRSGSGPAVVLAFFIAAVSSILSGLCYAEFGARVPKAGSGYVYSYVTMGELCAFTIGWNLVLSYVVGASSVSKAWSANLDTLIGCKLRELTVTYMPYIGVEGLEDYPDLFAGLVIILLALLLAAGAKEFAIVNKLFTGINIGVIIFVLVAGMFQIDFHNWSLSPQEVFDITTNSTSSNVTSDMDCKALFGPPVELNPPSLESNLTDEIVGDGACSAEGGDEVECFLSFNNATDLTIEHWPGIGGFTPYGFQGILSGTATCFYAFVGFDAIATTGEEAINPQRNIPLAIVFSLLICCIAYLCVSATLTLMVPYFLLDKSAPLPVAFASGGIEWAKWPVGIGAVCALTASLLGCMFPLPRVVYAMADDGLIFRGLANINEKTKTPVIATLSMASLAALLAAIFDIKELVDFMSIGTLMAYTLVAASVMILRYRPTADDEAVYTDYGSAGLKEYFSPPKESTVPTERTNSVVSSSAAIFVFICIVQGFVMNKVQLDDTTQLMVLIPTTVLLLVLAFCISRQPQSSAELAFSVPALPWIPLFNIWVNVYLMTALDVSIWIKLSVWLAIGYSIYFFYGIKNSSANPANQKRNAESQKLKLED